VRITVSNAGRGFEVAANESILDGALQAGFNLPHSCRGGNCGSCRARLIHGHTEYPSGKPLGLTDAEIAEGHVLLCQARALGDLSIEIAQIRPADERGPKRLPCRVQQLIAVAHDVQALYLRLPAAESFVFEPGQYLDVLLTGGRRRSFSIASPPHDARLLELHVRKVAGGLFSEKLFEPMAEGSLLSIEGPLGNFRYRDGTSPMLLLAGGTGLAPLKSIWRHVLERHIPRALTVYAGARSRRDLYEHDRLNQLIADGAALDYIPVLSEPDADWTGRTGLVHVAAMEDIADLAAYDTYAAGPPGMIEAVQRDFKARGVEAARLHVDSFDFATDPKRVAAPLK
jgi:CDP-4-dehydro-6-deoxyglucose reductase, E3